MDNHNDYQTKHVQITRIETSLKITLNTEINGYVKKKQKTQTFQKTYKPFKSTNVKKEHWNKISDYYKCKSRPL